MKKNKCLWVIGLIAVGFATITAQTKQDENVANKQPYVLELKASNRAAGNNDSALRHVVRIDGAAWLRLHVADYELGMQSFITFTSLLDGGTQRLDAKSLPEWRLNTAFFNGDAVKIELHLDVGETETFVRFTEVTVGIRPVVKSVGRDSTELRDPETICGPDDDRTAGDDSRVGRINLLNAGMNVSNPSCTAWIVSNGALLTAGHCVDGDPDGPGPMLPDGVIDPNFLNGVVEFNVPASQDDGTTVFSNPNFQYPIGNVAWRFNGVGQGLGRDWAVFAVNRNSNTGVLPHLSQSFFRMTNEAPPTLENVTVTGYGIDNTPPGTTGGGNAQNQTLQTHTGPYVGETVGADFYHNYRADTAQGNSGSPIIWTINGFTIGIHTTGGCTSTGGANAGTSFEVDALETALQNFIGQNTIHVDSAAYPNVTNAQRNGSIFRPHATVTNGVNAAQTGGIVSIVPGTYNGVTILNRAMTIQVPAGTATIRP